MNAAANAWIVDNALWAPARPELSVLIPFYRDTPVDLLRAFVRQAEAGAEIIVLDDGTGDDALAARVSAQIETLPLPARFIRRMRNEGRAKGRNRLATHARGEHLLFLDADMLPDRDDFLAIWSRLAAEQNPAVVFGGFTVDRAAPRPELALHRAMARKSDCLPAQVRAQNPAKSVFTSNLLVRRDVFAAERFDETFTGWGWEDVEWAMRVAERWPIEHIENTASHLGLDTAEGLARKYEQSAANFGRLVGAHRAVVESYPSFKVAKQLKKLPGLTVWRSGFKAVAVNARAPLKARAFAMRLYRAALYAEVV